MRLIEFCPGEGSRFLVGAAVLSLSDARPIGGTDETVLVVFGGEKEMFAYNFECSPRKRDTLAHSYVAEKFPRMDAATLTAAHPVIAHLLGRDAFAARYSPETLGWEPSWQAQLLPLVEEILDGLDRGATGDAVADYLRIVVSTRKAAAAANALVAETLSVFGGILVSEESEVPLV